MSDKRKNDLADITEKLYESLKETLSKPYPSLPSDHRRNVNVEANKNQVGKKGTEK